MKPVKLLFADAARPNRTLNPVNLVDITECYVLKKNAEGLLTQVLPTSFLIKKTKLNQLNLLVSKVRFKFLEMNNQFTFFQFLQNVVSQVRHFTFILGFFQR